MKRLQDYDEYGQDIPRNKPMVDLERGRRSIYDKHYVRREEFEKLQTDLANQLADMNTLLEQLLLKIRQLVLHAASMSNEDISSEDAEE